MKCITPLKSLRMTAGEKHMAGNMQWQPWLDLCPQGLRVSCTRWGWPSSPLIFNWSPPVTMGFLLLFFVFLGPLPKHMEVTRLGVYSELCCGSGGYEPNWYVSRRMWVRSLASHRGLRIWCCRELWCRSLEAAWILELLWLWPRPVAVAPIRLVAWEPPYAVGVALKKKPKKPPKNEQYSYPQKIHGDHVGESALIHGDQWTLSSNKSLTTFLENLVSTKNTSRLYLRISLWPLFWRT